MPLTTQRHRLVLLQLYLQSPCVVENRIAHLVFTILAEAKNQQANAKQSAQAVDDDFLSNLGF